MQTVFCKKDAISFLVEFVNNSTLWKCAMKLFFVGHLGKGYKKNGCLDYMDTLKLALVMTASEGER